jgi:hypothetical protein
MIAIPHDPAEPAMFPPEPDAATARSRERERCAGIADRIAASLTRIADGAHPIIREALAAQAATAEEIARQIRNPAP